MMSETCSADGVWRNLRLVPDVAVPDVALQAGSLAAAVVEALSLQTGWPTTDVT